MVDLSNGSEIASSVFEYPYAVMDAALPCGVKLGMDFALKNPKDYLDVLSNAI